MTETLKNLRYFHTDEGLIIHELDLKAEAVKWIKEDIKLFEEEELGEWNLIERWMKRLNITEEDLK